MKRQTHYTLIEVLVAIAVLALMMSFIFQFTSGAQRVWRASNENMDVSSNADVIFSLLDEDLGQMQVDAERGLAYNINASAHSFGFYTISSRGGAAATDPQVGSLLYVRYQFDSTNHKLHRVQANAEDGGALYAADNNTEPVASVTLPDNDDDHLVADGVQGFEVTCTPNDTAKLPNLIRVKVTLDRVAKAESDKGDAKRVFSRVFFIGMR